MTPKELEKQIGVDAKIIRRFARKQYGKPGGTWNFTQKQIEEITAHFGKTTVTTKTVTTNPITEAVNSDHLWYTEAGLRQYAKNWLKETYNLELEIPIYINNRLSRMLGYFKRERDKPHSISIARRLIDYYGKEVTLDVLKHELIHYACYLLGKPFGDGDWYFENELKKHGVSRTRTYKFKGMAHVYSCQSCGKVTSERSRKIGENQLSYYYSRCCHAPLKYEGKKEIK